MDRLADLTREFDLRQKAAAVVSLAVAGDTRLTADRLELLQHRGVGRYAKGGDVTLAGDMALDRAPLDAALIALVDQGTLIGRLDGALRIPLAAAARLQAGELICEVTDEGDAVQPGRLSFDLAGVPSKVASMIVVGNDLLRDASRQTQDAVTAMLAAAIAKATDTFTIGKLTAGTAGASADPGALLAALGRAVRPYLIADYTTLLNLPAGTVRDLQALNIGVLPCAAAAGVLVAVDAAGVLVSDSGIEVATGRHPSLMIDMTGGSPAAPALVSLWQANLTALRAIRFLRVSVRSGAVAFASVGSPS